MGCMIWLATLGNGVRIIMNGIIIVNHRLTTREGRPREETMSYGAGVGSALRKT